MPLVCHALYTVSLYYTNPQCMRSRVIIDAGHCCLLPLTGKLSTDEANDSGFLSTQRVCMVSYTCRSNKMTSSSLIGALYVAAAGMTVICLHIMVIVLKDSWRLEADLMRVGTAISVEFNTIATSRLLL